MTPVFVSDPDGTESPTVPNWTETATQRDVGRRRSYYSQSDEFSSPKRPGAMDAYSLPSLMHGRRVFRKQQA